MSRAGDKSAELDRRASLRQSARLSVNLGEGNTVYEEDYDLAALAISDGFRPSDVAQNHAPISNYIADGPAAYRRSTPPPRPSSISKPPRGHDSFALRHDGATGSNPDAVPTRASSTSTNSPFITPETPYQGPTGPSYPYQMYQQNTRLARTASLATTSTMPVSEISERSYNGPSGPTHPYGMYPQNTVPESEDDAPGDQAAPVIPVGFPGTVDQYQRRIGAEGEEAADLIGPDGHTEQLPPYTRYPDEAYNRKVQGIETPAAVATSTASSSSTTTTTPTQAIPGAGGLGLATRNPEFGSRDDLGVADSPHSRQSLRSFTSEASQHDINTAAHTVANEKPHKGWKKTARKQIWGVVPVWAVCLAALVLLVMCVILASVLGTLLSHKKKDKNRDDGPEPASMSFDAVPLSAVPADLPELPLGLFGMPLLTSRNPATCFNDTLQAQSWTCNIVFAQIAMIVNRSPDNPTTSAYTVSIVSNNSFLTENFVYSYGMQPPKINDVELSLYNDTWEPSRGPAWAFQVIYNKTIIVPESFLAPTSATVEVSSKKRGFPPGPGGPGGFQRKDVAKTGDKPWICHWDGTFLEAFIYAGQDSSVYRSPSSTMAMPFTPSPTPTETSSEGGFPFPSDMPEPPPPYPKVVKMEERRAADSPAVQPWCRQYEIMGEGVPARPYKPDGQNFADVFIVEEEPSFQMKKKKKKDRDENGDKNRRTAPRSVIENYLNGRDNNGAVDMSDCGCMWWLT